MIFSELCGNMPLKHKQFETFLLPLLLFVISMPLIGTKHIVTCTFKA